MYSLATSDLPHAPNVTGWPVGSTLDAGAILLLTCTAASTGGTPTSFKWHKGNDTLESIGTMGEMFVKSVAKSDTGTYKCKAIT